MLKYKYQNNLARIQNLRNFSRNSFKKQAVKGLSVVILNLNKPEFLLPLVKILKKSKQAFSKMGLFFEILIGDTGSSDETTLKFYDDIDLTVIKGLSYHFSKNNNEVAFNHSQGVIILFMNNDMLFEDENFLLRFYEEIIAKDAYSIFGHVLLFENDAIQHRGIKFKKLNEDRDYLPYHVDGGKFISRENLPSNCEFNATTGAFLAVSREDFLEVNGFNEDYEKEGQDIDLCLKVRRLGKKINVLNLATIYHFENGTRVKGEESNEDRALMFRLWSSFVSGILKE